MTAASTGGWVEIPRSHLAWNTSDGSTTLDATTDYVAWVCKAPATGTIDKIYARIAGTTLSGTLSCQIQTLDSAGDPSGTAYGSCAQSDVAVTGTEDNTQITFSSLACSATVGDYICVRIWASTVTSGSVSVLSTGSYAGGTGDGFPYITTRTTGTGAGTHTSLGMGPTVEYSGAVYYDVGWPPTTTFASETIDSDGSVRRLGNIFTLPVPVTAVGIWAYIDNDTDTTVLKLYDSNGTTELATATLASGNRQSTSGRIARILFDSGAAVSLSANVAYRVVATTNNTSATAAGIATATAITAAHMAMLPLGTACYHTAHNGTVWSETTTKRCAIGLLVSQLDDGRGLGRAGYLLGMN